MEFLIFLSSVIVTIFSTTADGIYTSVGASIFVLLYRIARPSGEFLGRIRLQNGETDSVYQNFRNVYVPFRRQVLNPELSVEEPPPGVFIYRFEESFTFPNASRINIKINK